MFVLLDGFNVIKENLVILGIFFFFIIKDSKDYGILDVSFFKYFLV